MANPKKYEKHERVYRLVLRWGLRITLPLVIFWCIGILTTFTKTHEAAQTLCERIVDQNPGAPPRWGKAADQEPIYENPLYAPSITYGEGSPFWLGRIIGKGVTMIEDGTIHHYPDEWYKYRTGRYYPEVTVPKHCAYSVSALGGEVDLTIWTWGQHRLNWHQSEPNTIPTATEGEPFAGDCLFSTKYLWFDSHLKIGDINQKCGTDQYFTSKHIRTIKQGQRLKYGFRYREHVVR